MTPTEIARSLTGALAKAWCYWTHGGGMIERDDLGRINWRCSHCGRWSDFPVPLRDEHATTRAALRAKEKTNAE